MVLGAPRWVPVVGAALAGPGGHIQPSRRHIQTHRGTRSGCSTGDPDRAGAPAQCHPWLRGKRAGWGQLQARIKGTFPSMLSPQGLSDVSQFADSTAGAEHSHSWIRSWSSTGSGSQQVMGWELGLSQAPSAHNHLCKCLPQIRVNSKGFHPPGLLLPLCQAN